MKKIKIKILTIIQTNNIVVLKLLHTSKVRLNVYLINVFFAGKPTLICPKVSLNDEIVELHLFA